MHRAAGEGQGIQVKQRQIGAHAHGQVPNIGAAQYLGAPPGGHTEGVTSGHLGRAQVAAKERAGLAIGTLAGFRWLQGTAHAGQQHGLTRLVHQVRRVIAGAAIHPQAHRHPGVEHAANGCNAAGQPHVAARAVRHPGAGGGKQADAFIVEFHAVRVPHIGAQPAQVLGVLRGRAVELFPGVGQVMVVFGQVGVQAHTVVAGQHGGLAHQVTAHAERRAGRHRHIHHGAVGGVVPALDQPLRVFQNCALLLDHPVRGQAALGLPHAHAAAAGDKAHANLGGGVNAVVQAHAVGVDVEVVAAGGAAAHQQFGHGDLGRDMHHVGRQAGPDRVEPAQPAKQLGVLYRRNGSRQALVHVVVRVDQPRHDQVVSRVNHVVGGLGQICCWPQGRNAVVPNEQRGVCQLPGLRRVGVVKGGNAASVFDQECGHGSGGRPEKAVNQSMNQEGTSAILISLGGPKPGLWMTYLVFAGHFGALV